MLFFVQTVGLLFADQAKGLSILNLDGSKSTGSCTTPFSYPHQFIFSTCFKPVLMGLGLWCSRPLWNKLRSLECTKKVWAKMHSPPQITRDMMKRGLLNVYLALYGPFTKTAIDILVCKGVLFLLFLLFQLLFLLLLVLSLSSPPAPAPAPAPAAAPAPPPPAPPPAPPLLVALHVFTHVLHPQRPVPALPGGRQRLHRRGV